MGCWQWHEKVDRFVGKVFASYGRFVARHPWKFIIVSMIVSGSLGVGFINLTVATNIEEVYTPINSRADQDRETVRNMFPDASDTNFYPQNLADLGLYAEVIMKAQDGNILTQAAWAELRSLYHVIRGVTVENGTSVVAFEDLCARRQNTGCVVSGDILLTPEFESSLEAGDISYPDFQDPDSSMNVSLSYIFGGAVSQNGTLKSAVTIKLRFYLRSNTDSIKEWSKQWQIQFLSAIETFQMNITDIFYAHADSLDTELDKSTKGDIGLFSVTFTIICLYATLATKGCNCNCVADRMRLGLAGVFATGMSVVGAFGLVSACGVEFVNIVGVMPFLILGIGVDDMFILLSGMLDATFADTTEERTAITMRTSGMSITITSLTSILAFGIGASSTFLSVRNFCIYTGVAILFCYINHVTFFTGCMVLHEKRVEKHRHTFTCRKVESEEQMRYANSSKCAKLCCSGSPPVTKEELESPLESIPRRLLPRIILNIPAKITIILIFLGYLGVSIWGLLNFKQGLILQQLVSEDSYYYKYDAVKEQYYAGDMPISFVIQTPLDYHLADTQSSIDDLLRNGRAYSEMDDTFELSWLKVYSSTPWYVTTTNENFINGLKTFLASGFSSFQNDIVFNDDETDIIASRFYLKTNALVDSNAEANMMVNMRKVADDSALSVFAFAPAFVFYEQYVTILPNTLQTMGIALGAVFLVTIFFMPHPLLVFYITVAVAMIMVGLFGFMYFLDLTLSSITMIHIIMSVGFSVDYTAHICHAFMQAEGTDRNARMAAGLKHSGPAICNGAISSFLGVTVLAFSKSYVFNSFFKVMLLVILFGIGHAVFLLPVILSLIGPSKTKPETKTIVTGPYVIR